MNSELLTGPLAQAIGWALLHLLWQGAIVAGILAASLALLSKRSANVRYAVSCSALALLLVLGLATAYRAYEPPVKIVAPAEGITIPLTSTTAIVAAVAKLTWRDRLDALASAADEALPLVVTIWLAGVVLLSSRLLITWTRTQRIANGQARTANEQWLRAAERLSDALGLRRAVRLVESAAVEVPSVIGLVRPVILLPASTLTGLTPEQIEMVLAHELAHIRRHDFFVNLLQALVETLLFYHPAVWWMSQRVRIERENCCDDLAVAVCGNPLQYARALTRLEELRADVLPVAVSSNGGSLLDRIRRIAGGRAESEGLTSRWAAAVAVLTIVVIALAAPSLPAFAQREKEVKKSDEAKKAGSKVEVRAEKSNADRDENDDAEIDAPEMPDPPDVDVPLPEIPPTPPVAMTPSPMPALAPMPPYPPVATPSPAPMVPRSPMPLTPTPAIAPAAPMAMAALEAFDWGGDEDADDEDRAETPRADGRLTVDELVELRVHGVTPQFIDEMRSLFPGVSVREIAQMRAVGVTTKFVRELRDAGLEVKSSREAKGLAAVGVTPEYLREIRAAGVNVTSARDAQSLRALDVTPKFVRQMADAGYTNLSVRDLTRLAAAGVNGDFIRDMEKYKTGKEKSDKSKNK